VYIIRWRKIVRKKVSKNLVIRKKICNFAHDLNKIDIWHELTTTRHPDGRCPMRIFTLPSGVSLLGYL
jgi:hypothetical protein